MLTSSQLCPAGLDLDAENRSGDASALPAPPDLSSADAELFKEGSLLRARPKDTGGIGLLSRHIGRDEVIRVPHAQDWSEGSLTHFT